MHDVAARKIRLKVFWNPLISGKESTVLLRWFYTHDCYTCIHRHISYVLQSEHASVCVMHISSQSPTDVLCPAYVPIITSIFTVLFLVNKTNRRTEFQFYFYYDFTCFGQPFCPPSEILSRTSALVHFMQLYDRITCVSWFYLEGICHDARSYGLKIYFSPRQL
jgi:hypothetical protein